MFGRPWPRFVPYPPPEGGGIEPTSMPRPSARGTVHPTLDVRPSLAAVDGHTGARHPGRPRREQEGDHVRHLVRRPEPARGDVLRDEARHPLRVLLLAAPPGATRVADGA